MQEKLLYEYAVIRIVPRVERQEFFNAGVIVYCAAAKFLKTKIFLDEKKLAFFSNETDMDDLKKRLNFFEQICSGDLGAGEIATLNLASRFRWLTAVKSTIVQTSTVHTGFTKNLNETVERLFHEFV